MYSGSLILPNRLAGDLTDYDELLISMQQLPRNYVLRNGEKLIAYAYIFTHTNPELGNLIAFTDGVFDETFVAG